MNLCINCLETGAQPRPIGPDQGTQRDPYRETIPLCDACWVPLYAGNLPVFHARFAATRTVIR